MWLRISSGRDSFPRLGWLGLALVVVWALPGTTQELSEPQIAAAFEGPRPALDVGDWTPPRELAESIRSAVARGWTLDADAVVIEWQEPDASIEGFREPSRLLGPGRGGSWIALLIDDDRRASLRFRAGIRVPTPLATADFPRAHTLGAFDIEWRDVVAWGAPEDVDTRSREGWITRRPIAAGEPLLPPLVSPRPAVTSGTNVTVRWSAGRVTVELPGRVVGQAARGEEVTVRLDTGLRVRGVVADEHTVVLPEAPSRSTSRPARRVARQTGG